MKKLVLLGMITLPLFSVAQQQLTLPDAITIALKNSLDLQVAGNNVQRNAILNNYGVAGGLPVISGTATDNEQITSINQEFANTTRNTKRSNVAANTLSASVTGSVLLYNGYRVATYKNRLGKLEDQSRQVLNSQVQNLLASVMTAYFDVVRQQSYIKTIDKSIEVSKQKLDVIKAQQTVGMANNADLFQAELDLTALIQSQQTQELVISQAKTELLRLLTLKADSVITVSDTIMVDNTVLLETVENRLSSNPDIAAAAMQVAINEYIVKETAAQRYPSLRGNTGYSYSSNRSAAGDTRLNTSYGPIIGVSLSVPFYSGSVYKRQQQAAGIDVKNADLQKKMLERDYAAGMVKTYQAYTNNLQQLEREQKNYQMAQQLLDLVLQRFELRHATIIDVRTAQQSFEAAGYRLVNLSFAAKSAEIELKRIASLLQ